MPNFATAILVKAQALLIAEFQKTEFKSREPVIHNLFLDNTEIMMPQYTELKLSKYRDIETNYLTRTARALAGEISHNHTGTQGDSATMTPAWNPYSDPFATTLKEADGNLYTAQEMQISKFTNSFINFSEGLESVAAAYLFANRSGVNVATSDGVFNTTDDTFEITESTLGNQAISITKAVMDLNAYQNVNYDIVCDSVAFRKFDYLAHQGNANATNTAFQFGNIKFILDASLGAAANGLVAAYSKGYWIVIPKGTIGALPWIPKLNRDGKETTVANFGQIMNPFDGVMYGIHTYETSANGTSLGGDVQDVVIQTEIGLDLAHVHAPLSTATESSMQAFALV